MNKLLTALTIVISYTSYSQEATPNGSVRVIGDQRAESHLERFIEGNKNSKLEGYRIQIYNGSKKEATATKAEFSKLFPEIPVEIIFETPEYKTQVGDFRSEIEADGALVKIREAFPSAFTLKAKINFPVINQPQSSTQETPTMNEAPVGASKN